MLFNNKTYLRAAGICLGQEKKRLKKLSDEIFRDLNNKDLVDEDHEILDEGYKISLFMVDEMLKELKQKPWNFIEKCYKAMEHKRSDRIFKRYYLAEKNKAHNPLAYREAEAYGICTHWDGSKERFFLHKGMIVFATSTGEYLGYPVEQFIRENKSVDCEIYFINNNFYSPLGLGLIPQWKPEKPSWSC